MYIRPSHRPRSHADTLEVVRQNMFATLVTCSREGMIASHLPFMIEPALGQHGTLFAHMARANPQSAILEQADDALVIFTGPHDYISPSWYEDRATAPTWNYVAVHCHGKVRVHSHDEARRNIERLIELLEAARPDRWSLDELSDASVQALLQNVVSFEIPLSRIEGKFKLSQGDQPQRIRAAADALEREGSGVLAAWMRRANEL
jgi:transcriptional regulator